MDEQVGAVHEVAPEVGPTSGGKRGVARVVVGVVAAAAVVAGGAVVVSQRGGEDATGRERLVDLQAFVGEHSSYSYTIDAAQTAASAAAGPGSSSTTRTHSEVEVTADDEWHVTVDGGDWATELLRISDDAWERYADSVDGLDAEQWAAFDGATVDQIIAEMTDAAGMLGLDPEEDLGWTAEEADAMEAIAEALAFTSSPAGTVEVIAAAVDAEVVRSDDEGSTLRLTPKAPEGGTTDDGAESPATLTVEVDLDIDGIPSALRMVSRAGSMSADVAVRFTDWDLDAPLAPPGADAVDATPFIDEDGVAAYRGSKVYVPSELPEGWEFYAVGLISVEDSFEGCEQLMIGYGPALDEGTDPMLMGTEEYLDIYVMDIDCALENDPTPFQESADGRLTRYGDSEIRIGDAMVQLDSSLGGDALDAVIASLVETDPQALIAG